MIVDKHGAITICRLSLKQALYQTKQEKSSQVTTTDEDACNLIIKGRDFRRMIELSQAAARWFQVCHNPRGLPCATVVDASINRFQAITDKRMTPISGGTVIDLDLRVKRRDPETSIRIALGDVRGPHCN